MDSILKHSTSGPPCRRVCWKPHRHIFSRHLLQYQWLGWRMMTLQTWKDMSSYCNQICLKELLASFQKTPCWTSNSKICFRYLWPPCWITLALPRLSSSFCYAARCPPAPAYAQPSDAGRRHANEASGNWTVSPDDCQRAGILNLRLGLLNR